jgi:TonB family protein
VLNTPNSNIAPGDVKYLKTSTIYSRGGGGLPSIPQNPDTLRTTITYTPIEQSPPPPPISVYTTVEQMPEFPGGTEAMMKFIGENLKYPPEAIKQKISGRVLVNFIVGKDGKIKNVKVIRGIGLACDEEAIRVVNAMPAWIPGKQKGEPVDVRFTLPITFALKN